MDSKEQLLQNSILGILLGTAVGDSLGLPYEGLSKDAVSKRITSKLHQCFFLHWGMVSDDTDLIVLTSQSLLGFPDTPEQFLRRLVWRYRFWILSLPAGIGMASLRSGIKLWTGFSPHSSGVFSAGNAPALRSSIIGALLYDQKEMREKYVRLSTQMTHTDPKAEIGAMAIANMIAYLIHNIVKSNIPIQPNLQKLKEIMLLTGKDDEQWNHIMSHFVESVVNGLEVSEYANILQCEKGITGFIYHTVPVAVYSWYVNYDNPDKAIQDVILCGGDTDSTAAIVGALTGCCHYGTNDFLYEWLNKIRDFPCSVTYLKRLSQALADQNSRPPIFHWWFWPVRNVFFFVVVIVHIIIRQMMLIKDLMR